MGKRVAVITDATSVGYLFPYWYRYYGRQFGAENLHVVTYRGLASQFAGVMLGSIEELGSPYDDRLRANHISARVKELLTAHDVVVRCDIDEFLLPDPRRHGSLAALVQALEGPFLTARGIDLVEMREDEPLRTDGEPLLGQRGWCVRSSSLSKTAVTRIPLNWGPGFHAADASPAFGDLYLLHAKFADVKGRIAWFEAMAELVTAGSPEAAYYSDGQVKLQNFIEWVWKFNKTAECVLDSTSFDETFLKTVIRNPDDGIYQGEFTTELLLRPSDGLAAMKDHC